MLTSIVLSLALAAPVPSTPPVPSGPAPRLLDLKAGADGKVKVTIVRYETQKVQTGGNGGAPAVVQEVKVPTYAAVELGELKDLKITTADGKKVEVADAVKQLKNGAVVAVSTDGKPVTPNFLKALKDDVLVLTSPELVGVMPALRVDAPLLSPAPAQIAPATPPK